MSGTHAAYERLAGTLGTRLDGASNPRTRDWWERYLKGTVPFRGVPMAAVRSAVHDVWSAEGLGELPPGAQIELALRLLSERFCEDKLAGVLVLAERLLDDLDLGDVPRLARPLANGDVNDWSTCDWSSVKVLGPFVERGADRRRRAEAIAGWRFGDTLWQRRAAAVAFVDLVPRGDSFFAGFTRLVLDVCASNVRDRARFSQTAVGWVLRELSRAEPEAVARFVREHADELSSEARRSATAKLSSALRPEAARGR